MSWSGMRDGVGWTGVSIPRRGAFAIGRPRNMLYSGPPIAGAVSHGTPGATKGTARTAERKARTTEGIRTKGVRGSGAGRDE